LQTYYLQTNSCIREIQRFSSETERIFFSCHPNWYSSTVVLAATGAPEAYAGGGGVWGVRTPPSAEV